MTTPDYLYRKAFFMADRNDVHVLIGNKHNKWSHNSNDDSWYAENFTQGGASEDRASFHYPNLERWLLRATQRYERGESKYNPFSGKNLAFVLHDKETEGTATVMVSPNVMEYARKIFRTDKDFVVEMFDWDLETLSSEQLMAIFNDIHRSFVTCSFSDTLGIATPTTLVAQVKTPALPARGKTNKRRIKEGKNMEKNVVKINENALRQIVAESVKKVLNEISADMYTRAAEKAYELGRPRQAQNFMDRAQDVGVDDFCKKLIGGEVIEADTDIITYKPRESSYTKTIQNDGYWMSSFGSRGNLANDTTMSSNLKVDDKVTARKLAAWWKKYGKTKLPIKLDDWHVWCNL